jgi:hypothetical protein
VKHFELSDAQKFEEVWQMKEQDVQELLSVLLTADKVISEQQLGFLWFPPSNEALQQKFEEGKRRALAAGKKRADAGVGEDDIMQLTAASSERVQEVRSLYVTPPPFVSHARAQVLRLLVDESGYLMDSKVIFPATASQSLGGCSPHSRCRCSAWWSRWRETRAPPTCRPPPCCAPQVTKRRWMEFAVVHACSLKHVT